MVNGISNSNYLNKINTLNINNRNASKENIKSFGDYIMKELNNTVSLEKESQKITNDFIMGKTDSIHDVTIAAEKAFIAVQLTTEIRNKVLDAYKEIMRMQL